MNKYLTPIAIVIVGILIAGSIFLTSKIKTNTPVDTNISPAVSVVTPVNEKDHILGNPQASIVVVEYGDTECPPCKMFHTVMNQVIDNYGKTGQVAWVFRHSPIVGLHSKAPKEAEATECATLLGGKDMFWKYIDQIYTITPGNNGLDPAELPKIATSLGLDVTKFNTCLSSGSQKSIVDQDLADALKITGGQLGTPHIEMILKNALTNEKVTDIGTNFGNSINIGSDRKHISFGGAYPYDAFKFLIDLILK
ncbi:MAG: DsbA family protein [Minisyncoccia bacterium]